MRAISAISIIRASDVGPRASCNEIKGRKTESVQWVCVILGLPLTDDFGRCARHGVLEEVSRESTVNGVIGLVWFRRGTPTRLRIRIFAQVAPDMLLDERVVEVQNFPASLLCGAMALESCVEYHGSIVGGLWIESCAKGLAPFVRAEQSPKVFELLADEYEDGSRRLS